MPDLSAGTGLAPLLTYAFAVFGVLALLGLVLWFVRRSSGGAPARKPAPVRRLAVVDQIALDDKRRLVLVQRDGVQHLVILGGANELLVEGGIVEGRGARRDWEMSALAAERERDLPAFPTAPAREAEAAALPERDVPARQPPMRQPPARPAARTIPEPRLPEPMARASAPEPAAEPLFVPAQRAAPAPRAREPGPLHPEPMPTPAFTAAPAISVAEVAVPAAAFAVDDDERRELASAPLDIGARSLPDEPVRRGPALQAPLQQEPVAAPLQAAPEPVSRAPEPKEEPARGGGLLARLARKRPAEPAPAVEASVAAAAVAPVAAVASEALADEARIAFSEPVPEMPDHAAFEPRVEALPEVSLAPERSEPEFEPVPEVAIPAPSEPIAATSEPDMSKLFDMIVPAQEPVPAAIAAEPPPPVPEVADGTPRTAVKIDPFFASMAQRLEETLRRPLGPPLPPPATQGGSVSAAVSAPPVAPESAAASADELELEMASLLGRAPQR